MRVFSLNSWVYSSYTCWYVIDMVSRFLFVFFLHLISVFWFIFDFWQPSFLPSFSLLWCLIYTEFLCFKLWFIWKVCTLLLIFDNGSLYNFQQSYWSYVSHFISFRDLIIFIVSLWCTVGKFFHWYQGSANFLYRVR